MRIFLLAILTCGFVAAASAEPTTQPVTRPQTHPESQPAQAQAADPQIDPATRATLERIAARGNELTTLKTRVIYDREQGLIGDTQRRIGSLTYDAGPPARFVFHLNRRLFDGRAERMDTRYIFDGVWMAERQASEKTFRKWQIVPPDADPAAVDPLARGEGPFVLPLKFEVDDILQRFDVTTIEPTDDDPEQTVHLRLTPRPGFDRDLDQLDVWWHRETLLPVKAENRTGRNASIFQLRDVETGIELDNGVFDTTEPAGDGWDVTVTPWGEPGS